MATTYKTPTTDDYKPSEKFAWIQPNEWTMGGWSIFEGDSFDKQYFGNDTLRIETGKDLIPTLAIKVKITGKKAKFDHKGRFGYTCKIEFLNDGEDSTFTNGIVYLNHEYENKFFSK